ncbi:hypothetical protein Clacol_003904 [Clathrus columnatus]|uniref:glutathione transferase n=1 Tax=Clathrus columnatus TaxID=1419009 RepID=A0AAV5A9T0_9AGAM|nr:hypothetical protein Clacol_003904 [Clathrus columnatus]
MVMKEKQVPYELIPIDLSKVDGDITLFESRAIARYIAVKYADRGTPLIPPTTDLVAFAKFEQAASIEQSNFDVYASGIAAELFFKPLRGGETNQKMVEYYNATLASKLDAYEVILGKHNYLAGDVSFLS